MSGQLVQFHTAVAVVAPSRQLEQARMVTVHVKVRELLASEIEHYLQIEKPYDCAGSAKAEGLGITLLSSIESTDPTALIGLPLIATSELLRAAAGEGGVPVLRRETVLVEGLDRRLDGLRVDYPDRWGLVRPSNTTPNLVLRFEGDDAEALASIENEFRSLLRAVDPTLALEPGRVLFIPSVRIVTDVILSEQRRRSA